MHLLYIVGSLWKIILYSYSWLSALWISSLDINNFFWFKYKFTKYPNFCSFDSAQNQNLDTVSDVLVALHSVLNLQVDGSFTEIT